MNEMPQSTTPLLDSVYLHIQHTKRTMLPAPTVCIAAVLAEHMPINTCANLGNFMSDFNFTSKQLMGCSMDAG